MRQGQLAVDKKVTVNRVQTHMFVIQVIGVQEHVAVEYYVQNVSCIEHVIHAVEWDTVYTDLVVWILVLAQHKVQHN